jgi:hypothetical protein
MYFLHFVLKGKKYLEKSYTLQLAVCLFFMNFGVVGMHATWILYTVVAAVLPSVWLAVSIEC